MGLERDNIAAVAEVLNLNKRLQGYCLQNKEGAFDWHKEVIGHKAAAVIYHEGDNGSVEVKEEMAFLNLFKYGSETKKLDMLYNMEKIKACERCFS